MKITNRKLLTFFISLASIIVLSILGKETGSIIGLFSIYCVGNVTSKFSNNTNIAKKEQI